MASGRSHKERIDRLLVDRQILPDESAAQRWIMSGNVAVNGQPVNKPGLRVKTDAEIVVRGLDQKYASRGGYKLEAALERFDVNVEDKVVLDAGAAAGGFTDCLVQRGASLVYAVDVGFGQMKGALAANRHVRNMERTNISDLRQQDLNAPIDLAVVDLSYLSLVKAVPILLPLFHKHPMLLCLIKSLFEGVPQQHKNSAHELERAIDRLNQAVRVHGLAITDLMVSPILGSRGTIEFLGLFSNSLRYAKSFESLRVQAIAQATERFPELIELP